MSVAAATPMCTCGHPRLEHSGRREDDFACLVAGCLCLCAGFHDELEPGTLRRRIGTPTLSEWPVVAALYVLVYWIRWLLYGILATVALLGLATDGHQGLKIGLGSVGVGLALFQLGLLIGEGGPPPR